MSTSRPLGTVIAIGAACVGLLAASWLWNLTHVPMLANDDAFIFLRFAQNWVDHGALRWNLGEPGTDGFTSFLYLVTVSAVYAVRAGDVAAAAWWVGQSAAFGTLVLCVIWPARLAWREGAGVLAALAAAGVASLCTVALSSQLAYWAHSLMDAPFVAFVVTLATVAASFLLTGVAASRTPWLAAAAGLAALSLTRPEGMLVVFVIGLLGLVRWHRGARETPRWAVARWLAPIDAGARRGLGTSLVVLTLLAGGHFGWHLARYGHPFPNPVYVKTAGVGWSTTAAGLAYLADGPASGNLPTGLTRRDGERIPGARVQAAINPGPTWPHLLLLGLLPMLLLASFRPALWRDERSARIVRTLALVPTGLLGLVVLAGGDAFYSAWRMVTPVLPALGLAVVAAVPLLRSRRARVAVVILLALLAGQKVVVAVARPARCAAAGGECGRAALGLWPTTLECYAWDHSHARQDRQVAAALRESFPPDTVVGQSDFLRIAAWLPNPVLDLSGLVNAELAHAEHAPGVSVFQPRHLLEAEPDVYFLWWGLVSPRNLARSDLAHELRNRILLPPPREYPPSLQPFFEALARLYRPASVALDDGRYFNFLVHRRAAVQMRGDAIELGGEP